MSHKIIKINRGDSFDIPVLITNRLNKKYYLNANEVVYFALLFPNQPFEEAFLIKGYTFEDQDPETGEIIIKVLPNDTRILTPGVYYYTVKLQQGGTIGVINDLDNSTEVYTLIERTKFIINE